jgi:hypothetical protein
VDGYALGKLERVPDFGDKVIGADPPLVFAKVLVVHQLTIIDPGLDRVNVLELLARLER